MFSVAILGYGNVGSGVAELLLKRRVAERLGQPVELKYALDIRDVPGVNTVRDFSVIEKDKSVGVVVETIGGAGAAYDFTRRALAAGKSVVTSNKELVAEHGAELLALARDNNVRYLFEGSVGGGIPLIRPMAQCLRADKILEVAGILNGTTNYILTGMERDGVAFDEALKKAQEFGYAEPDPSADVDGADALRKICILASLAFGKHVYPRWAKAEGIRSVTCEQTGCAWERGYRVRLIGRAQLVQDGRIAIIVAPHLVPCEHPLYAVSDVNNAIAVDGDYLGRAMFYGRGAGKEPTASAVVNDIMECALPTVEQTRICWADSTQSPVAEEAAFGYKYEQFPDGTKMRVLS